MKLTVRELLSPPGAYRREISEHALVFGNMFDFRTSFVDATSEDYGPVRVSADMKIQKSRPGVPCWMGLKLRSTHYFANYGHLVYVVNDGTVVYTRPLSERGDYQDKQCGKVKVDPIVTPVHFDVTLNRDGLTFDVGEGGDGENVHRALSAGDEDQMPFIWSVGKVMFQAFRCWVELTNVEVTPLDA